MARLIIFSLLLAVLSPFNSADCATRAVAPPPVTIEINILASETNKPVSTAEIAFYNQDKKQTNPAATTKTSGDGKAHIQLLPGFYQYAAKADGYGLVYSYINIEPDKKPITIWLNKAASLKGRLVDSTGNPVPGIHLHTGPYLKAVTDKDGRFEISGMDTRGHELVMSQNGWSFEKRAYLQLSAGQQKDLGNLTIKRSASLTVSLKLKSTGRISSPAGIGLRISGPSTWRSAKTDPSGKAEFRELPPGNYSVSTSDGRIEEYELQTDLPERGQKEISLEAAAKQPSLSIDDYGELFLPGKPIKMRIHGLWVEKATARLLRIPLEKVTDGTYQITKPELINGNSLQEIKAVPISLKQAKNSFQTRGTILLPKLEPGAYLLDVSGGGASTRTAMLVTRLGLVAKIAPEAISLLAVDLLTGAPLPGVRIGALSKKAKAETTGPDGTLDWKSSNPKEIVARHGNNLALLALADNGEQHQPAGDIKGYLYTERTAYRPGQEVFFKGIARRASGDDYTLPQGGQVQLKISDSGDKEIFSTSLPISEKGAFQGSFRLSDSPSLGEYRIRATSGQSDWQGRFKVLEYRKPEFEVKLRPMGQHHLSGGQAPLRLTGRYYFGAPVAGAKVTWRVYAQPYFDSDLSDGPFGEDGRGFDGYSEFIAEGEAVLDSNGEAIIMVNAKAHETAVRYQVEADVTDLSSRQVSGSANMLIIPSLLKVGIKSEQYLLAPGKPGRFRIVVTDWDGNPVANAKLNLLVEKNHYDRQKRSSQWIKEKTLEGLTGKDGIIRIENTFNSSGFWRIKAETRDSGNRISSSESYAWVWRAGDGWNSSYRELETEFDKKVYSVGDTARLIVRSPSSSGHLLVTLEGRRIHLRKLIRMSSSVQVVEIPVTKELAPNMHVSAVMVHGGRFYQQDGLLKVDFEPGKLHVAVTPEKPVYAPGDKARVRIETSSEGKPATSELSLAVVDEAIFAVAPETKEEIYRFFRGKRDHLVTTIHSFPRLYLGGASKDAALAAAEDELKGIKIRKVFKDTAGWFPVLDTDSAGSATAEITLPDNLTTWRATAIAHSSDSRFGSGQAKFISRLPFMTRLSPPRFMVSGDRLEVPGLINEAAGKDQKVIGRFETEGLTTSGNTDFTGSLPAGGSIRRNLDVTADKAGQATLRLTAKGDGGSDALELTLPVLPATLKREIAAGMAVKGNDSSTSLELPESAIDQSGSITAEFSPTVAESLLPSLERLISFPYGCVEQTLSKFVPAVYAKWMLGKGDRGLSPELEKKLPAILTQGMKRLEDFQHDDGGWGWWKDDASRPELTAMVMLGFANARKAGLKPDEKVLHKGSKALDEQLSKANPTQAALLYRALTANGGQNPQTEELLSKEFNRLPLEARLAFVEGLANIGKLEQSAELLKKIRAKVEQDSFSAWLPEDGEGWRWGGSSIETTSTMLSLLSKVAPQDPLTAAMARYLARNQRGGWWQTTASSAAAVIALSDYTSSSGELTASYTATLSHNGKKVETYRVENGKLVSGNAKISIKAQKGENRLAISRENSQGSSYLSLTMEYQTSPENIAQAKGLKLTRKVYRIKTVKDGDNFRHEYTELKPGEAVNTGEDLELRLMVENEKPLEYLILEDHLPAGFEVRNAEQDPRYSNESWYHGWYDHKERRDTLMAWFIGYLPAGNHQFRSVIYPELKGKVTAMPAAIWPMYRPDQRSESSAWQVTIR